MQIFNRKKALELVDGDESLLEFLTGSFLNENKFDRAEFEKFIEKKNFAKAAGYVHATKGAARQLCLEKLQEEGQNLEDVLRGKTQGDIFELKEKMFSAYSEAVDFLKNNPQAF